MEKLVSNARNIVVRVCFIMFFVSFSLQSYEKKMKVQSVIGFFSAVRGKYSPLPSTNLLIGVSDEKQETGLANSLEETKDYRRGYNPW